MMPVPGRAAQRMLQADTHWALADGTDVEILNVLDDHSRLLAGSRAFVTAKAADVVETFYRAANDHGFPATMLTDNGAIFTAESRHGTCAIELELLALGIAYKHSRPYHPQTCGKVERFHQTLKRWLAHQPAAATIAELQAQLDWFGSYYNTVRPTGQSAGAPPPRPSPPAPRRSPPAPGSPCPPTIASGATRSTTPARSPCATTATCSTSASAAPTTTPGSSSLWPTATSGS